jgi:AP-1-like factor
MELREYRKRLSLNSTGASRNAPATGFSSMLNTNNSNFQFEFPRFGGLPGSQLLENGPLSKPKSASMSTTRPDVQTFSAPNTANGSLVQSPVNGVSPMTNGSRSGSTASARQPSNAAQKPHRSNTDSSVVSQSRVFQFNSGSSTHSDSPSTSSTSPTNQDSSCGTSPEPGHTSPDQKDTIADGYVCHGNSEGEVLFCEKLNMACGNPRNPVPRAKSMSKSDDKPSPTVTQAKSPGVDLNGIDFFANQNNNAFEPSLFGEYRDTNTAIMGTDGDFNSGFFNDAFNTGYGSPFHFGDTPAVQKPNPLEQIERIQDGEEEVVPGEDIDQMLNCHKIWSVPNHPLKQADALIRNRDKLSSRNDFKEGTIDIDNLCSELRAKARCSESGVVVDHKDVEEALKRLPKDQQQATWSS